MTTHLESLAEWSQGLRASDIPARVWTAAEAQILSVLASCCAARDSHAARLCRRAALALRTSGRATVLPTGESAHPYAAVLANAAASMAHDFDDYLFLGHTGHSTVLATLAVAEEIDATIEDLIVAQVAANEVAGRLGAFSAIGPHNGQLWSHIHLAAAATAGGKLRGLSPAQMSDALAIAFYQPPFALAPGFMGSEAKCLTAAQPAATGLYAAELAASGLRGSRGIIEHPRGFGHHFAFATVPQLLGGLGRAWVSDSLSCKRVPGCAYVGGPVEAALAATGARPIAGAEIERVDLSTSALTVGMEAMVLETAPPDSLEPIAINFSARRSVAIAILAGALSPRHLDGPWLVEHGEAVQRLAGATSVKLSAGRTLDLLAGINRAVPLGGVVRALGVRGGSRALRRLRATYPRLSSAIGSDTSARPPTVERLEPLGALSGLLRAGRFSTAALDLDHADFGQLEFRFGARIAIHLVGGQVLEGECRIPSGAAGSGMEAIRALARDKLAEQVSQLGAPERAETIDRLLTGDRTVTRARELARSAVFATPETPAVS